MPQKLNKSEWRHALGTYLLLKKEKAPITAARQEVARLSSTLQAISTPENDVDPKHFRTREGLAKRVKVFCALDQNRLSEHNYMIPQKPPRLAVEVWEEHAAGDDNTQGSLFSSLDKNFHAALEERENYYGRRKDKPDADIYILIHKKYPEFIKVGWTGREPEERARRYSDGSWRVFARFPVPKHQSRDIESTCHNCLKSEGHWIPPEIVKGQSREVFRCDPGDAIKALLQIL